MGQGENMKLIIVVILGLMIYGCSGPQHKKPCTLSVDWTLSSDIVTNAACQTLTLTDEGRPAHDDEVTYGCYQIKQDDHGHRYAVVQTKDDPDVWVHELRHLFHIFCGDEK
jgi:hypothetical protein